MSTHPDGVVSASLSPIPAPGPLLTPNLKFAVLHLGARMHYAVPALLERADMLQAFYTDIVGNVGMMNLAHHVVPSFVSAKPVRRLLGRRLPDDVPKEAVVSSPLRSLAHAIMERVPVRARSLIPMTAPVAWLQKTIVEENFRGANALYCMNNSDLNVVREAKRLGMFVVYEQICCPEIGRILRRERDLFPDLEHQDSEEEVEQGISRDIEVWRLCDLVLAPSNFVRDSMVRLGCPVERIAVVPYGLAEDWFDTPAEPRPGRVLFVGSVGLPKGNHYLAEAQRILQGRGLTPEFRVIGPYNPRELASPIFQGPEYVGQVPRDQVRAEFAQADVFAFPTLAESFGLVHLEAMACGVPVVTTPNCGSVVRDGTDGYIVPVRNPQALADRIEQLLRNPALRARMSGNARERAKQFSWAQYSRNLLKAILRARGSLVPSDRELPGGTGREGNGLVDRSVRQPWDYAPAP